MSLIITSRACNGSNLRIEFDSSLDNASISNPRAIGGLAVEELAKKVHDAWKKFSLDSLDYRDTDFEVVHQPLKDLVNCCEKEWGSCSFKAKLDDTAIFEKLKHYIPDISLQNTYEANSPLE